MEVARYWRLKDKYYGLVGEVCPHCETPNLSGPPVCPHCGGETKNSRGFTGKGKVYLYEHDVRNEEVITPSTIITNPNYFRKSENPNIRDVETYSEMLKPENPTEIMNSTSPIHVEMGIEIESTKTVIYQSVSNLV